MPEHPAREDGIDAAEPHGFDPKHRLFEPPKHPPLRDRKANPRGVRHIGETAQDQMPVTDRPRYQAAQNRRAAMIAATKRRLSRFAGRRRTPSRRDPPSEA